MSLVALQDDYERARAEGDWAFAGDTARFIARLLDSSPTADPWWEAAAEAYIRSVPRSTLPFPERGTP